MWTNAWRWLKPWTSLVRLNTPSRVTQNALQEAGLLSTTKKKGKRVFYTLKSKNAPSLQQAFWLDSVRHLPEDDFKKEGQ
ncbi:hypothetical protein O9992_15290 [Vibrio lentus]|nr:hypothetical protein [Vibrio lentus]